MVTSILLIGILGIATFYDLREHRIPNLLVAYGVLFGFLSSQSFIDLFWKTIAFIFLYFFGMLRLMGLGDLKLWIVISSFVGFKDSCWIMVVAAILLILYGWIRNRTETEIIFRHLLISLESHNRPELIDQTAYAFAPFVLAAAVLYLLKEVIM